MAKIQNKTKCDKKFNRVDENKPERELKFSFLGKKSPHIDFFMYLCIVDKRERFDVWPLSSVG